MSVPSAVLDPFVPVSLDWDALLAGLPQVVTHIFSELDTHVLKSPPRVAARSGKTVIRDEALFIYRNFFTETHDTDSIVVGLTIERNGAQVVVRGDIANEESGKVHFELKPRTLSGDTDRIMEEARKAAETLAEQWPHVIQALAAL